MKAKHLLAVLLLHDAVKVGFGDDNSCLDRCDELYFPNKPCYCNTACLQYENCCYDYIMLCQPDLAINDTWTDFNGHSYRYFTDGTVNARQAAEKCRDEGGMLVSINTPDELAYIEEDVLRKRTLSAFIGASDVAEEGTWLWADGTFMPLPGSPWHRWYPDEPDNAESVEHCGVITNYQYWAIRKQIIERYEWRDYSCDFNPANEIQGYICERTLKCDNISCENGGRCVYIPGPKEFKCICQSPFVGQFCQYEEIPGVEWTICGETNLTESKGIIQSPLYPETYPANVRCDWLITLEAGSTLSINIDFLEIEMSKRCALDYLLVYDGPDKNSPILFGPLCGTLSELEMNDDFEQSYVTSSSEVLVEFRTDEDIRFAGFSLSYSRGECGYGTGQSGCDSPSIYTSSCGEIEIEHGPEGDAAVCEWYIEVDRDMKINLTIVDFNANDTGTNCSDGGLFVYDGDSENSPLLAKLCGQRAPVSLFSTSRSLYLRLEGLTIYEERGVRMTYQSINSSWEVSDSSIEVGPASNYIVLDGNTPAFRRTDSLLVYQWKLRVPYGFFLDIEWQFFPTESATMKVYKGEESTGEPLWSSEDGTHSSLSNLTVHYFKAIVQIQCLPNDCDVTFWANFNPVEWNPEDSGCFRPQLYENWSTKAVENSLVSILNPLVVMVSDKAYDSRLPGYDAGLYCKWRLKASRDMGLVIDFVDVNIYPVSDGCQYDGLVVIAGNMTNSTFGPFCGKESVLSKTIDTSQSEITLVFYSDPSQGWRHNGVLRALVEAKPRDGIQECPIWQMAAPVTYRIDASCGIILSPNFPGLVGPGLWFWVFTPPSGNRMHYSLYVYYVRGPGTKDDDCDQSFKVIEIPRDSEELRQYEANILTLCGDTELFEPPSKIKLPPMQKFGIELKTISNAIDMRWEFKVAFTTEQMELPAQHNETGNCPTDYVEWRGYCYRYYPWLLRHYYPEYFFQTTWQNALRQCELENGTLLSIYDEEEAYFLQYTFATRPAWAWDGGAPYQQNTRLILIGLHNRQQVYQWTTGVQLGYADWYRPLPEWAENPVADDSYLPNIVNLNLKQPTADSASLCAGALPISPFGSMNWVKIPCDYPLFRAGVVCKQPLPNWGTSDDDETESQTSEEGLKPYTASFLESEEQDCPGCATTTAPVPPSTAPNFQECPQGWFLLDSMCYTVLTQYSFTNKSDDVTTAMMTFTDAIDMCQNLTTDIPRAEMNTTISLDKFLKYLDVWNHTEITGNILVAASQNNCTYLQVLKENELETELFYEEVVRYCSDRMLYVTSVICVRHPIEHVERCGAHEFQCDNGMCIATDYVCDSHNDCKDNSDERGCDCGLSYFTCDNGDCVSLSLRCDFFPHCVDGSDESHCVHEICKDEEFRCDNGQCINASAVCDFRHQCADKSDEAPVLCAGHCDGFQCYSGLCLDPMLQHDNIADCPGLTFEDERDSSSELQTFFGVYYGEVEENITAVYGCKEGPMYTNCHAGDQQCYLRADMCVYDTLQVDASRGYDVLTSCRDGMHLRKSCDDVECPGMYHCRDSFCIPPRKLCDSHKDCPQGDDELNCPEYICPGLFHCKDSDVCIAHSEVCDGIVQCPGHGEDERHCSEADMLCDQCLCHGHIIYCDDNNVTSLPVPIATKTRQFRGIFLSMNNIAKLPNKVFSGLHWLTTLVLSRNRIDELQSDVFNSLKNLLHLDLSYNRLSNLKDGTFRGLSNLKLLDLKNNRLETIKASQVSVLVSVRRLVVEENRLDYVTKGTFDEMTSLETLNTDAFKFCCVAKHVKTCTPEADEFSSCEDLMANPTLQICIWILGFTALVGNAFVVVWRLKTDRKKSSSFFIINLGCSDFLMGVYMIIIASVDVHYRGNYIVHSDAWRSSWLCQLCGVIATISSEVSVFMLTTITVERCLTLMYPLKFGQMRLKNARIIASTGWLFCVCLSILPLTKAPAFGDAFYGRTGVCLPFIVSSQRLPGWEYSVFIFLVLNLISFIIIFVGYTAIFITVKSSIDAMGSKSTGSADEYALAKKLALIVASDFVCWVPIILIGFAALGGATIAPEVSAWIAVFILPLNSAINPVLYTISAIDCGRGKKKRKAAYSSAVTSSTAVSRASTHVTNGTKVNHQQSVGKSQTHQPNDIKQPLQSNVTQAHGAKDIPKATEVHPRKMEIAENTKM